MKIYASMLAANPSCFGEELRKVSDADGIHWDIMDGSFVDAISFGANVVQSLRKQTQQIFDVHLMVKNPEKHIKTFANAGANIITVHAEATHHLHGTLQKIKSLGKKSGVAINPATSIEFLPYVLDVLDVVLIMTVNPGKSGQTFIMQQIDKIKRVTEIVSDKIAICVDGGINEKTILPCVNAGAKNFVVGSRIFNSDNYSEAIKKLRGYSY